jgi:RNA polymerase subunit RPABC4/transcription elongation factor Spt4
MIVEEYGICPNCTHEIEEDSKFCPECGSRLEWQVDEIYFPPDPEKSTRYGTIKCDCGQTFYFESQRLKINCLKCNKEYDISGYPIKGVTPSGTAN